ncbi:3-isopropylmalate dehydratase small subunit [Desulfurispira natronophila]|uniref:3-isopropylmalate dehydratase n=1 Tax=Desulfurispira natronophila TaxID=682562 RepID=A0A7W7Y3Z6_9BACT|nr:3-isopropylmalate dehydratase small subunit [Desulfurispira natronophila]MBB5021666.1 3-isopropylmalate/(R)-2-methylmalate dehydratase small subunit [Desulfurispira natronophila]
MKSFGGPALFLDRDDINTDEIIPAKYLTELTKDALQPYLLEDLKLEGFDPHGPLLKQARVIVTRNNFGCGSSREHAPWALEVNDITLVVAASYARIFRQNMFNCGMMAVELSPQQIDEIFTQFSTAADTEIQVDLDTKKLMVKGGGQEKSFSFNLNQFDEALVRAGGWVAFADEKY